MWGTLNEVAWFRWSLDMAQRAACNRLQFFPLFWGRWPEMRTSRKASLACPRQGRLHADGRLLSLRIIARQRGSASDVHILPVAQLLFAHMKAVTCHPIAQRESETPRRRPSCVHRASSSSNDSNPTYQDAADAPMTLTWLLLGFSL
jgi:hypothetical protein